MVNNVWVEELRPKTLSEVIGNELVIKILKGYVASGNIPHLLFSGSPGIGKTTVALALAEELYGSSKSHFVEINACLSEDTQILTKKGWKEIDEIQYSDIILGYDSKKDTLQWEKINEIFKYDYDGELVNIKTKYTDILVTPNHSIPVRAQGSRHIRKVQVDCLPDNFYLPLTSKNYDCIDNKDFTDNELKILGWLLTDGHINKDYQKHKYISQSESKYSTEIKEIFDKIPNGLRKETVYEQKEPYLPIHSFVLGWELSDKLSVLINQSKVLRIDTILKFSKRQLEIISDSMMKGDGSYLFNTTYGNTPRLYTPHKETAENFSLLCILCGFRPKIGFIKQKSGNILWYVNFTERSEIKINKKCISKKQYNGVVWCISCESHFFIARRNGSIFISGNSDERGIDVVRGKIKEIAIKGSDKIIFLDEADELTREGAQTALRRTIEKYAEKTRFILSCNYRHKIIPAIQSRLTPIHLSPLTNPEMNILIDRVCAKKSIVVPSEIREILFRYAKGDARHIINPLQSASMLGNTITKEAIQVFTQTPDLDTARLIVNTAISGDFNSAFDMCITSFINKGFDYELICEAILEVVRGTYVFNWKKILGEDRNLFLNYLKSLNIVITEDTEFTENDTKLIVKTPTMTIIFAPENTSMSRKYVNVSKSNSETYELMIDNDFNVYKPLYISTDKYTNRRLLATINAIIANHYSHMGSGSQFVEFAGMLSKISMIQSINSVEQVI